MDRMDRSCCSRAVEPAFRTSLTSLLMSVILKKKIRIGI